LSRTIVDFAKTTFVLASAPLLGISLVTTSGTAHALDLSLKLEPGLVIPLNKPQSQLYDVGIGQTLKLLFGLTPWLDIGPAASFVLLPAAKSGDPSGAAWTLGAGFRVRAC
jgi:hypothetical protein